MNSVGHHPVSSTALLGLVRPEDNPCVSDHILKYKYSGMGEVLGPRGGGESVVESSDPPRKRINCY